MQGFVCSKWHIMVSWCIENVWKMCPEVYQFDASHFLSAPGLAWKAALRKTKVLDEEYVNLYIEMQKLITNTWKIKVKGTIFQYIPIFKLGLQ